MDLLQKHSTAIGEYNQILAQVQKYNRRVMHSLNRFRIDNKYLDDVELCSCAYKPNNVYLQYLWTLKLSSQIYPSEHDSQPHRNLFLSRASRFEVEKNSRCVCIVYVNEYLIDRIWRKFSFRYVQLKSAFIYGFYSSKNNCLIYSSFISPRKTFPNLFKN